MSLNSGPINTVTLNGAFSAFLTVEEALSETLSYTDISLLSTTKSIIESLSISESNLFILLSNLLEDVGLSEDSTNSIIVLNTLSEVVSTYDTLSGSFKETLVSSFDSSESLLEKVDKYAALISSLGAYSETVNKVEYLSLLLDNLGFLDKTDNAILETLLSNLAISEDVINQSIFNYTLLDILEVSESYNNNPEVSSEIVETLKILSQAYTKALFNSLLTSDFIALVSDGKSSDKEYISYLLSPETFSVTEYTNYNFNGSCKFDNKYLFINEYGLYLYGGLLDDLSYIKAEVATAALSFGTSNLKQIPNFYMGLSNSNRIILKVRVDGKSEIHYKLNKKTKNLQTQKIPIGKGLVGRYFQFDLITQENTHLELSEMEFMPITLKRKL